VLAEREHIADRAQRSSLRRRSGDGGDASGRSRTLGDAVAGHLRDLNVPAGAVTWDAYRREDGRWALTGDFEAGPRKGAARFAFDAPGNFVVTENDDARWLIGDLADAPERPAPVARKKGPERRLSAVPSDELPLGDDAIEMVRDDEETAAPVRAVAPAAETPAGPSGPSGPSVFDEVLREDPDAPAEAPLETVETVEEPVSEDAEAPKRPARKKGARASVPSWDEIMFGGGKQE
jgi:hypothetical protein